VFRTIAFIALGLSPGGRRIGLEAGFSTKEVVMNDRYAKWGASTGILTVILIGVGFGGLVLPDAPDFNASGTDWAAFYIDHQSRIQVGATIVGVGLFTFTWFLGSVRAALANAEGGGHRLASIAFGGGILSVATLIVAVTAAEAAALRPADLDPNLVRALQDFSAAAGAPGAAGFTAFFAATAIAGYRFKAVPAPIAGFSALAAITQPLAYGVGVTTTGAFAGDGIVGGFLPVITFAIAVLALSGALMKRPEGYASASG
jgi:hypothetical protein